MEKDKPVVCVILCKQRAMNLVLASKSLAASFIFEGTLVAVAWEPGA